MTQAAESTSAPSAAPAPPRLGEELPIFCEKCGYQLHGLAAQRCPHCAILHFACPECGHHQPINTLRPAFQRILGRARAWVLSSWVVSKVMYFVGFLVAWAAMGVAGSYDEQWSAPGIRIAPAKITTGLYIGFSIAAFCYGMVGRMLLLRWRRGWLVGIGIAIAAVAAILVGGYIRQANENSGLPSFLTGDFAALIAVTGLVAWAAAIISWGVWSALVLLFLPRRVATVLLDWQRASSHRVSALAREKEQSP